MTKIFKNGFTEIEARTDDLGALLTLIRMDGKHTTHLFLTSDECRNLAAALVAQADEIDRLQEAFYARVKDAYAESKES